MKSKTSSLTYAALLPLFILFALMISGTLAGDARAQEENLALDDLDICPLDDPEEIAEVHQGRFCSYSAGPTPTCATPIEDELLAMDARLPNDKFELIELGTTFLGETLRAVRIGKQPPAAQVEPVPQIVVFATQHAREWITTETAMELIRHFAEGPGADSAFLERAVLTIMPVNNPDGHNYTHTDERMWRMNRWECPNGNFGVDTNRNYPFNYAEPGNDASCSSEIHRGSGPGSEPETQAARDLIAGVDSDGRFETVMVLNIHSYGSLVLFADGFSEDFAPCTTNSNCTNADLGAQHVLGGTRVNPFFYNERGVPFRPGQSYRNLIVVAGDLSSDAHYGDLPDNRKNPVSITLELGDSRCGFIAESYSEKQLKFIIDQQIEYAYFLLGSAPGLHDGSFYDEHVGTFALPHIHRRMATVEHPTLRLAARNTESRISLTAQNGDRADSALDDVLDGVAYREWKWNPSADPFEFPREIEVCPGQLFNCQTLVVGGLDIINDTIDLCDSSRVTPGEGWFFIGREGDFLVPQAQCYWQRTREFGSGPWILDMNQSLFGMEDSTFTFSYYHGNEEINLQVFATTTDFEDCGYELAECRIIFSTRHRGTVGWILFDDNFILDPGYRTEILDISDFDGEEIKIRFQLFNSSRQVGIFDPVATGWRID